MIGQALLLGNARRGRTDASNRAEGRLGRLGHGAVAGSEPAWLGAEQWKPPGEDWLSSKGLVAILARGKYDESWRIGSFRLFNASGFIVDSFCLLDFANVMSACSNPWPETADTGDLPGPGSGSARSGGDAQSGVWVVVNDPMKSSDDHDGDTPSENEDGPLMARIAAGDADAFAAFYDRHSSLFFGLVCRILGDEQEAEDVVQEACVSLWERAPQYDASLGRPLSWATTLVRNRAIDRLRARIRRSAVFAPVDEAGELSAPPAELRAPPAADLADTATLVRQTLLQLPGAQRAALEMAYFGGLTHLEISQQLAVPLGTIKARIRRGLLALRDTLEGCL